MEIELLLEATSYISTNGVNLLLRSFKEYIEWEANEIQCHT